MVGTANNGKMELNLPFFTWCVCVCVYILDYWRGRLVNPPGALFFRPRICCAESSC